MTTLSSKYFKKMYDYIERLFRTLETPFQKISVIKLFSLGSIAFKITDYDRVQSEFLILPHHCYGTLNLLETFKTSEFLKDILPNVNKMQRLVYTASVSTTSNDRAFSKLKIVNNYLS